MSLVLSTAPFGSSIFDPSQAGFYQGWRRQVLRARSPKTASVLFSGLGSHRVASGKWVGGCGGEVAPLLRVCFLMWPTRRFTGDPIMFLQFS
jgi:hypothetical protein